MRSLHLIDIENLLGDPWITGPAVGDTYEAALAAGEHRPGDLVYVAANRWMLAELGFVAHTPCHLFVAHGEDGADIALLAHAPPEWVAKRFDRLVIASGDHIFATRANAVREMGVLVDVVRGIGGVSRDLLAINPRPARVCVRPASPNASRTLRPNSEVRPSVG